MNKKIRLWFKQISKYKYKIIFSILFFIFAGIFNYFTGVYADHRGVIQLNDPLFRVLPSFSFLGPFFVYGIFVSIAILLFYPLFFRVKDFAFTFSQFALLVVIRNFFVLLSNLKSPADAIEVHFPGFINNWNFNNDLFFSGHVAIPLLGFFIFKDSKMKYFFLFDSVLMGALALLTHLHYTIDILGAIFIGYSSFALGFYLFDKKLRS